MISILIISAILFIAAKLIHKDKDLIDFTSMLALVIAPAIAVFLVGMVISYFKLSVVFNYVGLAVAFLIVFFFSNSFFEWGHKKAGVLASIYLVSSVFVQFGLSLIIE